MAGLAVFAVAQALEAAGAFGSEGDWLRSRLNDLHGSTMCLGILGVLLTLFGLIASAMVAAAARMGLLGSRWMTAALTVPIAAVGVFVAGAFVFGY